MRSRRLIRCATCGLPPWLCVCTDLPALDVKTRVVVIGHRAELFKSTNTGKLAARLLPHATVRTHGEPPHEDELTNLTSTFVLFPRADALPLQEVAAQGITRLLVPDGTWTQAKRISRRDPACARVRAVRLEVASESQYRLRRNVRPEGLCTLEAVAEALRVIEGAQVADDMLAVFERWTERSLRVRAGAHMQQITEDHESIDETNEELS